MKSDAGFRQALSEHPEDALTWSAYADWLKEHNDPRGELLGLLHTLTQAIDVPNRPDLERRLRELVAAGVRHPGPKWTNSIGMSLVWVPPGVFLMGSPESEPERNPGETQHPVTLTKGFWMGVHPVTVEQWEAVLGPSAYHQFKGKNMPVTQTGWLDACRFADELSRKEGKTFRLPTEAEWEYACRAGTTSPFFFGDKLLPGQATFHTRFVYGGGVLKGARMPKQPTPSGKNTPNAWGLCDMHGNVAEWCADWLNEYPTTAVTDPLQTEPMLFPPPMPTARVLRGGCWHESAGLCRSAWRGGADPVTSHLNPNSLRVCCAVS
jgi:uncharacterized protein (TIGR02996 family)